MFSEETCFGDWVLILRTEESIITQKLITIEEDGMISSNIYNLHDYFIFLAAHISRRFYIIKLSFETS